MDGGRLLERAGELAALEGAIRDASSGRGSATLLRASAGLGKSALLRAIGDDPGIAVHRATGHELEQGYPYGVVLRLLEPVARALCEEERDEVFAGAAGRVRPLLAGGDADLADPFAMVHGLYWFIAGIAEREPLALVVDDLQWADAPSLRVLHYLAGRVADLPVAIVGGVRHEAVVNDDVNALLDHDSVRVLDLAPLSERAVSDLVGGDVPEDIRSSAHRLTGGNPLLVQELVENLRSMRVEGGPGDGRAAVLPTVASRLRRLSTAAQRIAAAAAAVEDAPLALVSRLADVETAAARDAAAELVRSAILASIEPISFVHPLVRASVIDGIETQALVEMHAAAAVLLDAQGAPPEIVAPHLEHADPTGDGRRVEILRSAARRASRTGGASHAVRWLRRALAEGASDDVSGILFDLARAEALDEDPAWRGRLDDALARAIDPVAAARELLRLSRVLQGTGAVRPAADVAWRGVELLDDESSLSLELLGAYALASQVDIDSRRGPLARLGAALDGRQIDDRAHGLLAHLAYERAIAGEASVGEVAALARRAVGATAAARPGEMTSVQLPAVLALMWCDELDTAATALSVLRERARATSDPVAAASAANYAAPISLLCCQPLDAAGEAETALHGFDLGWRLVTPGAAGNLALARLELDDHEGADRALVLPDDDDRWRRGSSYTFWLFAAGSVALATGRVEEAIEVLRECGARQELMGSRNPMVAPWRSTLAQALARSGDTRGALVLAGEELDLARRFGAPRGIAVAERALALVGDAEDQVARLEHALDLAQRSPARIEVVRCLIELGAALRRRGAKVRAREVLRAALDEAASGGAALLVRRAREELGASGARPRSAALHGPAALTPSERRVALLAAQGRRNREIAEELFVSVKAVEFHLGNCFRKLGIDGRADLDRALSA